jgi:hypothetical protein
MKKWVTFGILAGMVIGMVLLSGCTNAGSTSSVVVTTPTPQIVYLTVLVTPTLTPIPTLTPSPTRIVGQDPIIGVWRCSDSKGYDHRIRFNADHTFVESWHNPVKPDIFKGTWRALGQNSYETVDDEFHYPDQIVYSPSRNVIYSKDIPTFVLSPYAGDVEAAT